MILFTDSSSLELYEEGKMFFAESKPLTGESDLFIIKVDTAVELQIQYEKDGLKVYSVSPEQVIQIGTEWFHV